MVAAGVCGEVLVADTEDVELETEVRSKRADLGLVVEGERITADFEFEIAFSAARPVPVSLVPFHCGPHICVLTAPASEMPNLNLRTPRICCFVSTLKIEQPQEKTP